MTHAKLISAKRALFRRSLYHTAHYLCGYNLLDHVHSTTIQCLEDDSLRKLIVLPRGCYKTSVAAIAYPIWEIIKNPNIRILLDSELWSLSRNSLREIKSHIQGDKFQECFPWKLALSNQDEIIISSRTIHKKEPTLTASGIGAGKTGQHYDLIIADDLSSERNALKPETAEKVVNHYRMYTSILDPGGRIVVIGTRYSELDLIGWILHNEIASDRDNTTTGLLIQVPAIA